MGDAELRYEVSELAKQANAAVIAHYGDTAVLATVVMGEKDKEGDFFPLTVDYEERFYASGKILGSRFVRREGKSSDEATLSGRLIDRTIRPLFDARLRREVQVTLTVLSYDEAHDPEETGLLATSLALAVSDIPWNGPVAAVRQFSKQADESFRHELFFAGPKDRVNMIEFEGMEIPESEIEAAYAGIQKEINRLVEFQAGIVKEIGRTKAEVALPEPEARLRTAVQSFIEPKLGGAFKTHEISKLKEELFEHLKQAGETEDNLKLVEGLFEEIADTFVHTLAIEKGERVDGRRLDEIRPLYAEVGTFRRMHGSAIFMRGDTQILAITTLASPSAEQITETMEGTTTKRFMLHYNFPKFATGEVGRSRGPGRREIGHGALAAKAIRNMIPPKDVFPYTVRVVAETLSSNGSSSMASTCAATLSLMDAGVPLKKPVGGISIGLMSDAHNNYKILTDIQGPEDHYGDMDFKVTGTDTGVTAVQMDVKVNGITEKMFKDAMAAAKKARTEILSLITGTLPQPRAQVSDFAPLIITIPINPDKIGEVIGPGGKVINGLIAAADNKVTIDIEQEGKVFIAGTDRAMVEQTKRAVESIVKEYAVGDVVEGPIVRMLEFGAIVDLGGGRDGMIHVSELKEGFVKRVDEVVKLGQHVWAKVIRIEDGRIGLSLKAMKGLDK